MPEPLIAVLGATGAVGEGITRALLADGHRVAGQSRSPARLADLRDRLGASAERLLTVPGDLDSPAAAHQLADGVAALGTLTAAVVAVSPGWRSGPALVDVELDEWRDVLEASLTPHLMAAQAFLPRLAGGGSYLLLNGSAALDPVGGAGPISVAAAAQLALARALAGEHPDLSVRSAVLMTPVISRTRPTGDPGWLTAEQVGTRVAALLAGDGRAGDEGTVLLGGGPEGGSPAATGP